ncbi:hypothetical protein N7G274_005560 [Stereocaulon virgatum]|uniref:Uncharacterized protein n=1 Tax=Stereocaulon virgatum TaxID=373712 RepID=A0ABR4AA59_9LECA
MHAEAIDYKKLAAIFGPNVPVAAIEYRLGVLRTSTPKHWDRAGSVSSGKAKAKRHGLGGALTDDASGDETTGSTEAGGEVQETENPITANGSATPAPSTKRDKTLGGRITKARISPRKNTKKKYIALEDPFAGVEVTDADGEKIFEIDTSERARIQTPAIRSSA